MGVLAHRAVAGEVLDRRRHAGLVHAADVGAGELGDHLRILGKRAVSDGEVAAAQVDHRREAQVDATGEHFAGHDPGVLPRALERGGRIGGVRSEEHTSELQSLMRISYAVFCLKKKKKKSRIHDRDTLRTTYIYHQ